MNKAQLFITWLDGQLDGVTECDVKQTNRIKEKLESIFEKHVTDPSKPTLEELGETHNFEVTKFPPLGQDEDGTVYRFYEHWSI